MKTETTAAESQAESNATSQADHQSSTDDQSTDASQADQSKDDSNASTDESKDASTDDQSKDDQSKDGESDDESDDDDDDEESKQIAATLKKLRSEARGLRTRLRTAEERVTELEAQIAQDGFKAKYETLVDSFRTERLRNDLVTVANKQGAISAEAVFDLSGKSKVPVEYDDDHKPTNVEAVVKALKEAYPKLFGAANGSGNAGARDERGADDAALSGKSRLASAYGSS